MGGDFPFSFTNPSAKLVSQMGNLKNSGDHTYAYDSEGRPVSVDSVQVMYDAFERPVEQNRSSTYTQILYSPSGQKFAFMNGSTVNQYLIPLVAGMQAVYNASGSGPQYYRHTDWLGSTWFDSTPSGTVYFDGAWAPFGEHYAGTGTSDRSFTGQTADTVTGLYDFPFRQYHPVQGRWLVPDPAGLAAVDIANPQTWNRYAYVGNNPLNAIDPFGLYLCGTHESDPWCNGGGQGAGGGGGYYGGAPQYTLDGLPISGPLSGFGFGMNDIAGILPPGCSGGACIVNGILVTPKSNGQFGGCSEGSGYYFFCIEFAPTPLGQSSLGIPTSLPGAGGGAGGFKPVIGSSGTVIFPVFYGLGPAVTVSYVPSQNLRCIAPGVGASAGRSFSLGPIVGDNRQVGDVLSGWSVSGGYQFTPWAGAGGSGNASGTTSGNTFGVPGASATLTYGFCF